MDKDFVNYNILMKGKSRETVLAEWREVKTKWGLITAGALMVSIFGTVMLEFYAEANGWHPAVALTPFIISIVAIFISAKKGAYTCPFCHMTLGRFRRKNECHCSCCGEKIW